MAQTAEEKLYDRLTSYGEIDDKYLKSLFEGFKQMVEKSGNVVGLCKSLLHKKIQKGFVSTRDRGYPKLTMESVILEDEFRHLFTPEELEIARRRLGRNE